MLCIYTTVGTQTSIGTVVDAFHLTFFASTKEASVFIIINLLFVDKLQTQSDQGDLQNNLRVPRDFRDRGEESDVDEHAKMSS